MAKYIASYGMYHTKTALHSFAIDLHVATATLCEVIMQHTAVCTDWGNSVLNASKMHSRCRALKYSNLCKLQCTA